MKKSLPILKLYNFYTKVFRNTALSFIALFLISNIFLSKSVEAVGLSKVIVDSISYDVWYVGSTFGERTYINADLSVTGQCWYNGVKDGDAPQIAYDKNNNKFTNQYLSAVAGINENIHIKIAQKGFCVGIKMCIDDPPGGGGVKDGGNTSYEFFAIGGTGTLKEKLYAGRGSLGIGGIEYFRMTNVPGVPTGIPDISYNRPATITECNTVATRTEFRRLWLNGKGNFHGECYLALDEQRDDLNETQAKEICTKYMCNAANANVKNDYQSMRLQQTGVISPTDYDNSSDPQSCDNLSRRTECIFLEPSNPGFNTSCTYDNIPATPNNCSRLNEYKKSNDIGLTGAFRDKHIFCSPDNKPVFCPNTVTTYEQVFQRAGAILTGGLKTGTGCELYRPPTTIACGTPATPGVTGAPPSATSACNLPNPLLQTPQGDPTACCFGAGSTDCNRTSKYFDSKDVPTHKIYCSSDNKVIRCPGAARSYEPGASVSGAPAIPGVFRNATNFSSSNIAADCTIVNSSFATPPGGSGACVISAGSASCTFGDITTNQNCYDQGTYISHSSMNLFCNSSGQTIACLNTITTYQDAFPAAANRSGLYTPLATGCSNFQPGMTSIPPEPLQQCTTEGASYYGNSADTATEVSPDQLENVSACNATEIRGGSTPDTAAETCRNREFGAGARIYSCFCDVSYNPDYNWFLCSTGLGSDCDEVCVLLESELRPLSVRPNIERLNPILVINTFANFLFGIAVLIFMINLLKGSFLYVSSGGDEGKLKEAWNLITNTIFGMVFVVFIGSLLRWITEVMARVITP